VDFVKGQDVIDLSVAIFTAAGAPGALAASDFVSGPGALAHDATDHVIHDTNTGMLYYDADGSGAQHMVPFAQVAPGQALAATDLHLIS
jgi:Ca2+-binding RTX toxin-like protein